MDINEISEQFIKDLLKDFKQLFLENPVDDDPYSKAELTDYGVFCNRWFVKVISALKNLNVELTDESKAIHQAYNLNPTIENLSSKILYYIKELCKIDPLQRESLEITIQLDYYTPRSESLLKKYFSKFDKSDQTLDKGNFYAHFKALLELEDIETLREYHKFNQQKVFLQSNGNNAMIFYLNKCTPRGIETFLKPNLDEVVIFPRNTTGIRNKLYVKSVFPEECNSWKAIVTKVSKICVSIEFDESREIPVLDLSEPVDITFQPQRQLLRYQHRALELFKANYNIQRFLFPEKKFALESTDVKLDSFKLINNNIATNPEQLEAVQTIVNGTNTSAPYIIFGPPGTGKTTTIVETILQLRLQNPNSRILVTAGSNAACDTLAVRLCEYFEKNALLEKHLEKTCIFPLLRIFSKDVLNSKKNNIPENLMYRSNVIESEHIYPAVEDIRTYGIIITTLCLVGKLCCANVNEDNYFTHVFIDEAGASGEPEALIAIAGIKNKIGKNSCHIILSGDHKQLGPHIKSDKAEEYGLGKSLMERLLEADCYAVDSNGIYDRTLQMRLRRNYRSHPEIVKLYNNLYYNNELIAMLTQSGENTEIYRKWSFVPNTQFPIVFQSVQGEMTKENTKSSCNKLEIENVINFIFRLMRYDAVKEEDIGIITPYRLQVKLIKEELENRNWLKIEVGTVENFQGREKKIIIASMVRSDRKLGFLNCPRRLNVLLSRPIALLIILGDPNTLNISSDFQFIINECKSNGNFANELQLEFE